MSIALGGKMWNVSVSKSSTVVSFVKGFRLKSVDSTSLGACHITSCSRKDVGYRCRFTLLGYKETTLIMCQRLLLLIGRCGCGNKLKLVMNWNVFLSVFSLCLCVIRGILSIPPVCITATQLLIKFPATNSRQHNDICITKAAPHFSVIQRW